MLVVLLVAGVGGIGAVVLNQRAGDWTEAPGVSPGPALQERLTGRSLESMFPDTEDAVTAEAKRRLSVYAADEARRGTPLNDAALRELLVYFKGQVRYELAVFRRVVALGRNRNATETAIRQVLQDIAPFAANHDPEPGPRLDELIGWMFGRLDAAADAGRRVSELK